MKRQARAREIPLSPDQIPSASTITRILARNGLLAAGDDPSRRGRWQRIERDHPNEL